MANHAADTVLGRVVVQEDKHLCPSESGAVLRKALESNWPASRRTEFLLTPGGFIVGDLPDDWEAHAGWDSTTESATSVFAEAETLCGEMLTPDLRTLLASRTDFLSIGVDFDTWYDPGDLHAELVGVYDTKAQGFVSWTGKSYPTSPQQNGLIHVVDIDTHYFETEYERVLVLACHDLTSFGGRSAANRTSGGPLDRRAQALVKLVRRVRPTIALQHPHVTMSPRTWSQGWAALRRMAPSLRAWASGIRFLPGHPERSLDKVLAGTAGPTSPLDIIVEPMIGST